MLEPMTLLIQGAELNQIPPKQHWQKSKQKNNQVFLGTKSFQTQNPQNAFKKTPQFKGKRTYLSPCRYNFEQEDNTKITATNCHNSPTETFLES